MATISKRRDRWVLDFYDNQGKRRWKTLPKGTTKGKAKEILREIEDKLAKGNYIPENKVPIFREVAQDWLEYKKPNVRDSISRKYEGYYKHHFDEILDLKINRINTARVEKYITTRQNAEMNLTTLRKLITTFNQIMNYAVRHCYIDHNPVRDAERPRGQGDVEKTAIRIFSTSEINAFINAVKDKKYRTLFMLAIMSGARQGELLGLKWSDLDWFNSQLHIQRTYNEGAWYRPKSKTSNRKIDLGPSMMAQLKKWRAACIPNEMDLIFPNKAGKPMNHGNMLRRHFYPALKEAGIPKMRFHDLRLIEIYKSPIMCK